MELHEIKMAWLEKRTQVLEVDEKGAFLQSCDTLFKTEQWKGEPLGSFFVLGGNTFPYWDEWEKHEWVYQGLELQIPGFHGLVDVHLEKHPQQDGRWMLFIIDHSISYRNFQEIQTKRNLSNM